jgi:hypothetical protein
MAPLPAVTGEHAPQVAGRCATCASPLAPDQLFCLSCGTRRRDARIAFRDVLATEAAPVVAVPPSGGAGWPPNGDAALNNASWPAGPGRISYMPFLATLALLLFALGIGVWVGRKPVQSVAAPAVAVPAAAAAATTPAEATPGEDSAADESSAADDTASSKDDDAAAEEESSAPVKDDTTALAELDKLSPEEYQKQSQKLPSEVGTGGTAPPKDDKPAGGGSEFEDFN